VHALLHHLEDVGFSYSPRVLGIDGQGREMLSYIDGATAWWPWPPALLADDGLRAVGRMIRELTQAVATFLEPPNAVWHSGARAGGVVRHGDLAPWNTVWDGQRLVGLIDWDTAEPAPPGWDLAQAAWSFIPLHSPKEWQTEDFPTMDMQRHRLAVLCDECAADPAEVLDAVAQVQTVERDRIAAWGAAGRAPYTAFLERGDVAAIDAERAWLRHHRDQLLGD
jgi:thiamine kinase-like enzyme